MNAPSLLAPGQLAMFEFCAAVRRGEPVPARTLEAIADRFEQVAASAKPAKAIADVFDLSRKRGAQPRIDRNERQRRISIAAHVVQLKRKHPERTVKRVCNDLARQMDELPSFVEDCYEQNREAGKAALALHLMTEGREVNADLETAFRSFMSAGGMLSFTPLSAFPSKSRDSRGK